MRLLSNIKEPCESRSCEFKVRPARIIVGFFPVTYSCTSTPVKQVVVLLSKAKGEQRGGDIAQKASLVFEHGIQEGRGHQVRERR